MNIIKELLIMIHDFSKLSLLICKIEHLIFKYSKDLKELEPLNHLFRWNKKNYFHQLE